MKLQFMSSSILRSLGFLLPILFMSTRPLLASSHIDNARGGQRLAQQDDGNRRSNTKKSGKKIANSTRIALNEDPSDLNNQEDKSDEPVKKNSRYNRSQRKFSLLLGAGIADGASGRMMADLYLSRDLHLDFEIRNATEFVDGVTKTLFLTSHLKYFVGNSFYISAGPGYSKSVANKNESVYGSTLSDDYKSHTEILLDDMGLEASIGNQWQWNHFTLGVDWVGNYLPLSQLNYQKTVTNTTYKDNKETTQVYKENPNPLKARNRYTMLYLGFAF
ncbi:MAG: hypothetical protein NTX25_14285 [Proteobacteria bacterium]|nr:hypothetical protein [Pseudomonadota bacterium]